MEENYKAKFLGKVGYHYIDGNFDKIVDLFLNGTSCKSSVDELERVKHYKEVIISTDYDTKRILRFIHLVFNDSAIIIDKIIESWNHYMITWYENDQKKIWHLEEIDTSYITSRSVTTDQNRSFIMVDSVNWEIFNKICANICVKPAHGFRHALKWYMEQKGLEIP